jgi:hypothetical protein
MSTFDNIYISGCVKIMAGKKASLVNFDVSMMKQLFEIRREL